MNIHDTFAGAAGTLYGQSDLDLSGAFSRTGAFVVPPAAQIGLVAGKSL